MSQEQLASPVEQQGDKSHEVQADQGLWINGLVRFLPILA